MDTKTISIYGLNAYKFKARHLELIPQRLYDLAKTFFGKEGKPRPMVSGEILKWLADNAFISRVSSRPLKYYFMLSIHVFKFITLSLFEPSIEGVFANATSSCY